MHLNRSLTRMWSSAVTDVAVLAVVYVAGGILIGGAVYGLLVAVLSSLIWHTWHWVAVSLTFALLLALASVVEAAESEVALRAEVGRLQMEVDLLSARLRRDLDGPTESG